MAVEVDTIYGNYGWLEANFPEGVMKLGIISLSEETLCQAISEKGDLKEFGEDRILVRGGEYPQNGKVRAIDAWRGRQERVEDARRYFLLRIISGGSSSRIRVGSLNGAAGGRNFSTEDLSDVNPNSCFHGICKGDCQCDPAWFGVDGNLVWNASYGGDDFFTVEGVLRSRLVCNG